MHELIVTTSKNGNEKLSIDKKECLFEAQLNKALGRPNIKTYKRLLRMCPELRRRKKAKSYSRNKFTFKHNLTPIRVKKDFPCTAPIACGYSSPACLREVKVLRPRR